MHSHLVDWLLDPENPSARYLTLTDLLDRPDDNPEVVSSRAAIPRADPARAILVAQYPQGYWMHPGIGLSPRFRATVWQILFLAQLGMARTKTIDRAVDHLFAENQREDGAFRASKEPRETPACLNGNLLWALTRLGYGDAPKVGRAWAWLAGDLDQRGFTCTHTDERPATCGAVKVLWASNAVHAEHSTRAQEMLSTAAAQSLLAHPPHSAPNSSPWFRLTFPLAHAADLLQWLEALAGAGYGHHPQLAFAWEWLEGKRLPDGGWPLEHTPDKLWTNFGRVGAPNKWVTIRALSVMRHRGEPH